MASPSPGESTSKTTPPDVALAGADGQKAQQLLDRSQKVGAATLGVITAAAVQRLLASGSPLKAKRLFSDAERKRLAKLLASTNGTGELLGRSRIRLRAEQAKKAHATAKHGELRLFAEEPTDFTCFDATTPIQPLSPQQAVDYFRGLAPMLNVNPAAFAADQQRAAFTLAVTTDEALLSRVHQAILDRIETGTGRALAGTLPSGSNVLFQSPTGTGIVPVLVDPAQLDAAWALDQGYYIPPGGGGAEIPGRRAGVEQYLQSGAPITAPRATLDPDGTISFSDGRHTFSVLRDGGIDQMPVAVPVEQAAEVARLFGSTLPAVPDALSAAESVESLLTQAGVSPANPSYASMVVRTNMMSAYNEGAMAEMQDPDVADVFPVWRYVGISDGRQRPSHEVQFDKYFSNDTDFADVRDAVKGSFDGFACRCTFIPTDRWSWAALQASGTELSSL